MSLKKLLLLLVITLTSSTLFAQVKVTGVVFSSEDNEPIIGATVTLKGKSSVGTATDIDGKFTLNVPSKKSKIVVASIGMASQEVDV